jgi:hypothetical protein
MIVALFRIMAIAPTIDISPPTPTANVKPVPIIPRTMRSQRGIPASDGESTL